jgi:hypothetical protein
VPCHFCQFRATRLTLAFKLTVLLGTDAAVRKLPGEEKTMFTRKRFLVLILPLLILGSLLASAQTARPVQQFMLLASDKIPSADKSTKPDAKPKPGAGSAVIWREPTDIASRDLFYGPRKQGPASQGQA